MNRLRAIVLFGASAAAVACARPDDAPAGSAAEPPAAVGMLVETVTVERAGFREELVLTAETEPVRSAVLSSQIPGRIVTLDVEEGQPVREGASVLRVDTAATDAQRAQLQTQLSSLEREIVRATTLHERGLGTVHDIESFQTQRALVLDQLGALDANIQQGRMRAPIGGIVVDKLAEVGEYANPGVPLARIVDISSIVVRAGLPEREITFVREGMEVPVHILATGEHYVGTLHRIGVEANTLSRTFPLEIRIDNASGRLRAGMRAEVRVSKRELPDAIVIPRDAILQGLDGPEVLVAEGSQVGVRSVRVGPGRGGFVVIESGLLAGDQLIVRGHRLLVPGESIRTVDLGACCSEQLRRYLEGAPDAETEAAAEQAGG